VRSAKRHHFRSLDVAVDGISREHIMLAVVMPIRNVAHLHTLRLIAGSKNYYLYGLSTILSSPMCTCCWKMINPHVRTLHLVGVTATAAAPFQIALSSSSIQVLHLRDCSFFEKESISTGHLIHRIGLAMSNSRIRELDLRGMDSKTIIGPLVRAMAKITPP
jgi:hypothetical protein